MPRLSVQWARAKTQEPCYQSQSDGDKVQDLNASLKRASKQPCLLCDQTSQ